MTDRENRENEIILQETLRELLEIPYGQYIKPRALGSRVTSRIGDFVVNQSQIQRVLDLHDLSQFGIVGDATVGYLIPECNRPRVLKTLASSVRTRVPARSGLKSRKLHEVCEERFESLYASQSKLPLVSQGRHPDNPTVSFGLETTRFHRVGSQSYRGTSALHPTILAVPAECVHEFIILGFNHSIHCEWCGVLFRQTDDEVPQP